MQRESKGHSKEKRCINSMDTFKSELTQTRGPTNKKRCKSTSTESNGTQSYSITEILENPNGSITSADDSLLKKTKTCIGRFFYENELDFGAVNSPSFQGMISLFCGQMKYQIPTSEEIKGWIFDDAMKEMHEYVDGIRKSWADTGCSVLLDEWTDANGQNFVNVLADCPKGTVYLFSSDITDCIGNMDAMQLFFAKVVSEVGVENVVQIITNSNSAFMKEVGKQLMEKYRAIFWTVSASYCIELMLEKLKEMDLITDTLGKVKIITRFIHSHPNALKFLQDQTSGSDLLNRSKIRSIQPFLTLENIVIEKEILIEMFLSSDANCTTLTSTTEGKRVADLVADRAFWSGASTVLNGAIPLVRVVEWINERNKEQMGYIYETIDQVKETIKQGFKNKKPLYTPLWKAIDDVWNELLYSPLHSASYFLNPNFFYSTDVYIDPEVVTGVLCCFVRSTGDTHVQDQLFIQLEKYRTAQGAFYVGAASDQRSTISPALWWLKYGGECPDLQRIAVRILSQTCDGASKFKLKRSWAETRLSKSRDRVEERQLADMVFLRYNMQLRNFASGKKDYITSADVDPLDDWLLEKSQTDQGFIDFGPSFLAKVGPL